MKDDKFPVVVQVRYTKRCAMPKKLEAKAQELGLTVSQLCRRFISTGMAHYEPEGAPTPSESLEEHLVSNGLIKPLEPGNKKVDDEFL